jgi:signal transduction histidine kinase/DNA-binding response OmpR family regulator
MIDVRAIVGPSWRRVGKFLPTGANLTAAEFQRRHRAIVWLVLLQDAGLFIFGLTRHVNPLAVVLECAVIAGLGGVAAVRVLSPRFRAAVATVALVITSSVVVQFSGGYIEAHFHFFVMLAVVFLYQDWVPFLLAIAYVAIDHGLIGSLFPGAVYNHPSALAHPFQWALIHAAFVLAESAALIAGWKIIESTENLRRSELTRFNQELARHADSLARSEEEARQANAAKSEFLASMSHELRTPMSSILGFAEVLADGLDGELNSAQREDLERIRGSGENLLVLLDDLLDLSKIEAGFMTLKREDVNLRALVETVLASLRPLAQNRSLYLANDGLDGLEVAGDAQRIRQVLTNLVGNAVKFTKEGGVTVRARATGDATVRVEVTDTGIGIAHGDHDLIFEEFRQAGHDGKRQPGGTGLGLAISRKLIQMHGGDIGVESELGKGSTFWFTLPAVTRAATEVDGEQSKAPFQALGDLPWAGAAQPAILVVDDDENTRQLIVKRLGEEGFATEQAANGEEALRLLRERRPLAITLDLQMPLMDGWDLLQALAAEAKAKDIPVILVSIIDQAQLAFPVDRVTYVHKPFTKQDLADAVWAVLPSLTGRTILVVDDDLDMGSLVSKSLSPHGAQVDTALSAEVALSLVSRQVPDLIFVDLVMPEMSGFELISRLRARPETEEVPIIVLSAKKVDDDDIRTLDGHIDRFISKADLGASDLVTTVRQVLGARRQVHV